MLCQNAIGLHPPTPESGLASRHVCPFSFTCLVGSADMLMMRSLGIWRRREASEAGLFLGSGSGAG